MATAPSEWSLPRLAIDEEGDWYDGGVQVTHAGILANLRANLRHDAEGYFIQTRVRIPVEVADVPWVVVRLERREDGLHGALNDGTRERIDPATLRLADSDVPYCAAKGGAFRARLSRAAAFQLLALAERDASGNEVLRLGDRTYPLRSGAAR
jgi:hypothetical protein